MTIRIAIETKPQSFPAGTVPGSFQFKLTGPNGYDRTQASDAAQIDFADATAPGDYVATVIRLDAAGNQLGGTATGAVTIPATDTGVSVDVPVTVTLSLV